MTRVLYPGSFDPITKGHMDIVEQARGLFDEVVIGILVNPSKKEPFFTVEERTAMIKEIYKHYDNIKVVTGTGAATDLAILHDCKAIIRGLRSITDFEYEIQMAKINKKFSDNKANTVSFFADPTLEYLSSSVVKEIFNLGKDISDCVEPIVAEKMLVKRGKV